MSKMMYKNDVNYLQCRGNVLIFVFIFFLLFSFKAFSEVNVKSLSDNSICQNATIKAMKDRDVAILWNNGKSSEKYVKEANRRRLTCNVGSKIETSKQKNKNYCPKGLRVSQIEKTIIQTRELAKISLNNGFVKSALSYQNQLEKLETMRLCAYYDQYLFAFPSDVYCLLSVYNIFTGRDFKLSESSNSSSSLMKKEWVLHIDKSYKKTLNNQQLLEVLSEYKGCN